MKKIIIYNVLIPFIMVLITYLYVKDIIKDDMTNIATMVLSAIMLIIVAVSVILYTKKLRNSKSEGDLVDGSWDSIKEYNNSVPKFWGLSFIAVSIWGGWYMLFGYPTWAFSQIGQYNEEVLSFNKKYEQKFENIKNNENELIKMGESLFLVKCAMCHGALADGIGGKAQDLNSWTKEEHIADVAMNGSVGSHYAMGAMPSGLVGAGKAKAVAAYITKELIKTKTSHANLVSKGKKVFETVCSSCHGMDGKGNYGLAPDLTNLVSSVLTTGRTGSIGTMPKFNDLGSIQKKALYRYIESLNNQ